MSENASIIGKPPAVFTLNRDPVNESSTWNKRPEVPSIENTAEPLPRSAAAVVEPDIDNEPVIPKLPVI